MDTDNTNDIVNFNQQFETYINDLKQFLKYPEEFLYIDSINRIIYYAYLDKIEEHNITTDVLKTFTESKPFLKEYILDITTRSALYHQPIICLMYYMIRLNADVTFGLWPFAPNEIGYLYSDMGFSTAHYW